LEKVSGAECTSSVWLRPERRDYFKPSVNQMNVDVDMCDAVSSRVSRGATCTLCIWFDSGLEPFAGDPGHTEFAVPVEGCLSGLSGSTDAQTWLTRDRLVATGRYAALCAVQDVVQSRGPTPAPARATLELPPLVT